MPQDVTIKEYITNSCNRKNTGYKLVRRLLQGWAAKCYVLPITIEGKNIISQTIMQFHSYLQAV